MSKTARVVGILKGVAGVVAVVSAAALVAGCDGPSSGTSSTTAASAPAAKKVDPLTELAAAQPSGLRAEVELSEMFALGSKHTDLQRENKLNEIKGQIVEWTLPVYEVRRAGDGYKIQTQTKVRLGAFGSELVGAFVSVTPRSDQDRQVIEALKTDDLVTFKGRIAGVSLRHFEIRPAVLVVRGAPAPQPSEAVAPGAGPAPAAVAQAPQPAEPQAMAAAAQGVVPSAPVATAPVPAQPVAAPEPAVVPASVAAAYKPSFECAKATNFAEKAVCADVTLGRLDGALAANYRHLLAADLGDGPRGELRAAQKAWLVERNKCADNGCLVAMYRKRIDQICDFPTAGASRPECAHADDIR